MANLVLDGADGILLGSETFRGKYPVQTVNTVLAICKQVGWGWCGMGAGTGVRCEASGSGRVLRSCYVTAVTK